MKPSYFAALTCLLLAGCAGAAPVSKAQQAENAACTAQADAQYQQNTLDQAGRSAQPGLRYGATPTHVFDAETMGAQNARANQIRACEETGGNNGQPVPNNVMGNSPYVTPHIITN